MLLDTVEVANPHGLRVPDLRRVRGELRYDEQRVRVPRTLRDDPLGQMHARKQIGPAQYAAGREYQATREAMGIGRTRSPSDIREYVDGGRGPADGITDRTRDAARRIAGWRDVLGRDGYEVVEAVLVDKRTIRQVADASPMMSGKAATTWYGHFFRRQLTLMARDMGLLT